MPDPTQRDARDAEAGNGMRVLTLTQPWASLVVLGCKTLETRSWYTTYRGPLLIHAAKGYPASARMQVTHPRFSDALTAEGQDPHTLPLGVILGQVTLTDVREVASPSVRAILEARHDEEGFGNYAPGRFAWLLTTPVRFDTHIPARGALGLWTYQAMAVT